ncbi:hypothetical protein [Hydrogenophaga laconesensis]|uniref:DUF2846 domain-containing protein n=1 Tax=Hydrogenophaga laconesensis TaxID=1805971 RepID=A0ABU1V5U6_9BURK|nr:hypothetical protein [Hydrogenophaga laconesensis]MDR7092653.1 hypothetical protein [Hydrogenophaga laconesensis]
MKAVVTPILRRSLMVLLAVWLAGCAFPQNYANMPRFASLYSKRVTLGYAGEPRPLSDVGVISHDAILYLVSVNGEKTFGVRHLIDKGLLYGTGPNQLHVVPGTYELEFCFHESNSNYTRWCKSNVVKTVRIEAGQLTFFSFTSQAGGLWGVEESDMGRYRGMVEAEYQQLLRSVGTKD